MKHDALPDEPLIAMVPVSIRASGASEGDTYQNRVSGLLCSLATNEADPVQRLRMVQQSMNAAKGSFAAIPAETLQDYTQFAPPAVAARAMRMYSRLRIADRMNPPFNVTISNVPGPAEPLYSAGARLEHFYPVSTIMDGQGLNMTVQSYNGNLDFGFISCRELVPDLWSMVDHLHDSMQELMDTIGDADHRGEAAGPAGEGDRRRRPPRSRQPRRPQPRRRTRGRPQPRGPRPRRPPARGPRPSGLPSSGRRLGRQPFEVGGVVVADELPAPRPHPPQLGQRRVDRPQLEPAAHRQVEEQPEHRVDHPAVADDDDGRPVVGGVEVVDGPADAVVEVGQGLAAGEGHGEGIALPVGHAVAVQEGLEGQAVALGPGIVLTDGRVDDDRQIVQRRRDSSAVSMARGKLLETSTSAWTSPVRARRSARASACLRPSDERPLQVR